MMVLFQRLPLLIRAKILGDIPSLIFITLDRTVCLLDMPTELMFPMQTGRHEGRQAASPLRSEGLRLLPHMWYEGGARTQ